MTDEPKPETATLDLGHALETLVAVQAFIAGRCYGELAAAGILSDAEAAARLAMLGDDIEGMAWPEPIIQRMVALRLREFANDFHPPERPQLRIVDRDGAQDVRS